MISFTVPLIRATALKTLTSRIMKWSIDWVIDWLVGWLVDWLIDWLYFYFMIRPRHTMQWRRSSWTFHSRRHTARTCFSTSDVIQTRKTCWHRRRTSSWAKSWLTGYGTITSSSYTTNTCLIQRTSISCGLYAAIFHLRSQNPTKSYSPMSNWVSRLLACVGIQKMRGRGGGNGIKASLVWVWVGWRVLVWVWMGLCHLAESFCDRCSVTVLRALPLPPMTFLLSFW